MKPKKINPRMWSFANRIVWLNYNADGNRVWGVLSKRHVVITNGFTHFHQAAQFIKSN